MGIMIERTNAQINIDRTPSRLDMQTQNARLDLHQSHAQIRITTQKPVLDIDQYEAFASAGLKNFGDLAREAAQAGQQTASNYVARATAEGNSLAAVEKGNPIPSIAESNAFPEYESVYDYIPKTGPKFSLREGTINIDPGHSATDPHHGVTGSYSEGDVNINYTPSQINVYLKQKASLDISFTGSKIDARL